MLPVFLIVTMVLVLKGLIMKLAGKDNRRLLEKEFQPYECTAPAL